MDGDSREDILLLTGFHLGKLKRIEDAFAYSH